MNDWIDIQKQKPTEIGYYLCFGREKDWTVLIDRYEPYVAIWDGNTLLEKSTDGDDTTMEALFWKPIGGLPINAFEVQRSLRNLQVLEETTRHSK